VSFPYFNAFLEKLAEKKSAVEVAFATNNLGVSISRKTY
jgi:hypothetical protein